jgi:hypothetical protein
MRLQTIQTEVSFTARPQWRKSFDIPDCNASFPASTTTLSFRGSARPRPSIYGFDFIQKNSVP